MSSNTSRRCAWRWSRNQRHTGQQHDCRNGTEGAHVGEQRDRCGHRIDELRQIAGEVRLHLVDAFHGHLHRFRGADLLVIGWPQRKQLAEQGVSQHGFRHRRRTVTHACRRGNACRRHDRQQEARPDRIRDAACDVRALRTANTTVANTAMHDTCHAQADQRHHGHLRHQCKPLQQRVKYYASPCPWHSGDKPFVDHRVPPVD